MADAGNLWEADNEEFSPDALRRAIAASLEEVNEERGVERPSAEDERIVREWNGGEQLSEEVLMEKVMKESAAEFAKKEEENRKKREMEEEEERCEKVRHDEERRKKRKAKEDTEKLRKGKAAKEKAEAERRRGKMARLERFDNVGSASTFSPLNTTTTKTSTISTSTSSKGTNSVTPSPSREILDVDVTVATNAEVVDMLTVDNDNNEVVDDPVATTSQVIDMSMVDESTVDDDLAKGKAGQGARPPNAGAVIVAETRTLQSSNPSFIPNLFAILFDYCSY